jgi:hypothetical protein
MGPRWDLWSLWTPPSIRLLGAVYLCQSTLSILIEIEAGSGAGSTGQARPGRNEMLEGTAPLGVDRCHAAILILCMPRGVLQGQGLVALGSGLTAAPMREEVKAGLELGAYHSDVESGRRLSGHTSRIGKVGDGTRQDGVCTMGRCVRASLEGGYTGMIPGVSRLYVMAFRNHYYINLMANSHPSSWAGGLHHVPAGADLPQVLRGR